MPPKKRSRRSVEREARDDMYTDSSDESDSWTPRGSGGGRGKKRSRSVGPAMEKKPTIDSPLLVTSTPKKQGRSRSATPGGGSAQTSATRRSANAAFERLPLPLRPVPYHHRLPDRLLVCGSNGLGQLGLGIDAIRAGVQSMGTPQQHSFFEAIASQSQSSKSNDWAIEQVACGAHHTAVITAFGTVLTWGVNDNGALGRSTEGTENATTEELETQPLPVDLSSSNFRPTRVCAGDSFTLVLSDIGDLRFWGSIRSSDGLLSATPKRSQKITARPTVIADAPRDPVASIAAGCDHAVMLTTEGHVYTFGNGQQGQLGRKVIERRKHHGLVPEKLALGRKAIAIGAGTYTSFAVTKTGSVFAWGLNQFRQCGCSDKDGGWLDLITMPTEVKALHPSKHGGAKVIAISGGEHHTLFLLENGQLWGCGRCDGGELGLPSEHSSVQKQREVNPDADAEAEGEKPRELVCEPVRINVGDEDCRMVGISCAMRQSFARSAKGEVYAFGYSADHALGYRGESLLLKPTKLSTQGVRVSTLSAGSKHTAFLGTLEAQEAS